MRLVLTLALAIHSAGCAAGAHRPARRPASLPTPATMAELIDASTNDDWRALDPTHTLYVEMERGRVIILLAPAFAPAHVANIELLSRERYFDGLPFLRSQDNYVVQWGDPDDKRSLGTALTKLAAEFTRPMKGLPFIGLPDADVYAPEVGFVDGLPAARDPASGTAWLTHCYGMVGVARDEDANSGNGAGLYVVIGHAPRHLDRNITIVGRVVRGMELLSTLPRGTGEMGFYETAPEYVPIRSIRVASDLPISERTELEQLRTDSPVFEALVESRRHRSESWFKTPVDHIELCNVPLPLRVRKPAAPAVEPVSP